MKAAASTGSRPSRASVVLFLAYAAAMLLLAGSAIIDSRTSRAIEASGNKVSRSLEAMEKLRQVGNTVVVAESAQRDYLITGVPAALEPYHEMQRRIPLRLAEIGPLVSDTERQRAGVARLRSLATARFDEMDKVLEAYRTGGQAAAMAALGDTAAGNNASLRELIASMVDEETRLLAERRAAAAGAYAEGLTRVWIASAIVGLALTGFYLLIRRFLRQRDAALEKVEATNAELEQRVVDRTADLTHLSRHLLNVREHEKKVIARDLHDDFGSYLTAINMDVSRARDKIAASNPEQAAKLERTLGLLNSAIEMKRQLISDLRPSMLDNLGLGAALEQYIDEWSRRTGIVAAFDYDGEIDSADEGCPIAVFRVFQEALANVAAHSQAARVAAHVYRVDDAIEFEIADDGIGLADADRNKPGAHGLLGIRERVLAYQGEVRFTAGPNGGLVVHGSLPCSQSTEAGRAAYVLHLA